MLARRLVAVLLSPPEAEVEVAAVTRAVDGKRLGLEGGEHAALLRELLDARLEGMRAVGRGEASFGLERDLELACAELVRITTLGTNPLQGGAPKRAGAVLAIEGPNVDADRGHGLGDGVGEIISLG